MRDELELLAKNLLRRLGFEVSYTSPGGSFAAALGALLKAHGVDFVFDVGAATGQYGAMLRSVGYEGRIVSFEPLSSSHRRLSARARGDELWTVPSPRVIGAKQGTATLHVHPDPDRSSLLRASDVEAGVASSRVEAVESVRVEQSSLVREWEEHVLGDETVFVKADVQGYEDRVIRGASEVLSRIAGWQIEVAFEERYVQQATWDEIGTLMREHGYVLQQFRPTVVDDTTGRMREADVVYFRDDG